MTLIDVYNRVVELPVKGLLICCSLVKFPVFRSFYSNNHRLKTTHRVPLYDKPLNWIKPIPPGIMPNTFPLTHLQGPLTSNESIIKHLNYTYSLF